MGVIFIHWMDSETVCKEYFRGRQWSKARETFWYLLQHRKHPCTSEEICGIPAAPAFLLVGFLWTSLRFHSYLSLPWVQMNKYRGFATSQCCRSLNRYCGLTVTKPTNQCLYDKMTSLTIKESLKDGQRWPQDSRSVVSRTHKRKSSCHVLPWWLVFSSIPLFKNLNWFSFIIFYPGLPHYSIRNILSQTSTVCNALSPTAFQSPRRMRH